MLIGRGSCRIAVVLAAGVAQVFAQAPTCTLVRLPAGESPPRIDAELDDAAWAKAARITELRQAEPVAGADPSEPTEVLLLLGPDALYIGLACAHADPSEIRATQMKRDARLDPDDRVEILIDPFFDRRNAFWFQIGAAGSLGDALVTGNGAAFNKQWNGIWNAAARVTERGWQAEMEIPYATLNFDPRGTRWGFNLRRFVRANNEELRWASPDPAIEFFWVANAGTLEGIRGLEQGLGLDLTPFAVLDFHDPGSDEDLLGDAGLDLFWRLTPSTKLALSFNTDFAETEVDERLVNLTRFPLFFPEKRDFFLEDSGAFHFASQAGFDSSSDVLPFFSRRIGLDASGAEVPLLLASKLTGQSERFSFGLLDVVTDETATLDSQNLAAGRVSLNVGDQSAVGLIGTSGDPGGAGDAATFGGDFNWRTNDFLGGDNLRITSWILTSENEGVSGNDWAGSIEIAYPNDVVELEARTLLVEEDFDPKLGFVSRAGIKKHAIEAQYAPRLGGRIRRLFFEIEPTLVTGSDNDLETLEIAATPLGVEWESGDQLSLDVVHTKEVLADPFDIHDQVTIAAGAYDWTRAGVQLATSDGRPVDIAVACFLGEFFDGERLDAFVRLGWRPNRWATFGLEWSENAIDLPAGEFAVHVGRLRTNVQFSPWLSWSSFVQFDNDSDELGLNSRLWWIPKPGVEGFLVINQGWLAEPGFEIAPQVTEVALKFGWTFRF